MNQTQIIKYIDGVQELVIDLTGTKYRVLDNANLRIKRIRLNPRYASVQTIEATPAIIILKTALAGLQEQQARLKLYASHVVTDVQSVILHDGSSQTVYGDYVVQPDDKYEVAFEMAKVYLAFMKVAAKEVQAELTIGQLNLTEVA